MYIWGRRKLVRRRKFLIFFFFLEINVENAQKMNYSDLVVSRAR